MVTQISDNEIYLLIKYIKSVLWRVAKCLPYTEDARCLHEDLWVHYASCTYHCTLPHTRNKNLCPRH